MAPTTTPSPTQLHQPHQPVISGQIPPKSRTTQVLLLTCTFIRGGKHPTCYALFTTASSYGSKDALNILQQTLTPASVLFDPKFTSQQRPSPTLPFRTFPPSPTATRLPHSLPSTISVQNLDTEENTAAMDKRHPSSFQQLEKLGEGTYATVCADISFA